MTLRLGGDGAITGCTSLENPDLTVSGLTISGSFDAEKVLVASGTAAAPSYTFSGDTDNGLYYAGTNSIGLSTAGTNAILIDSSGNVGIGTTNPSGRLTIKDGGYRQGIVLERSASTVDRGFIYIGDGTNSTIADEIYLDASNTAFHFRQGGTGTTETVTFKADGKVGIGDSSPNTNLVVKGASNSLTNSVGNINVISTDSAAINAGGSIGLGGFYNGTSNSIPFANLHGKKENGTGNNAAGYFAISTRNASSGTAERMRIDSSGRLGIGTSSPTRMLEIKNSDNVDTFAGLKITSNNQSAYVHYGWRGLDGSDQLRFATGTTEQMRIDSSGNVGIGTTSPLVPLVVSDGEVRNIEMGYSSSLTNNYIQSYNRSTSAYMGLTIAANPISLQIGSSEAMRIDSNGRVGFGNSNPSALGTGRLVIGDGTGSETLTIFSSSTSNGNIHFADGTSGQDRYRGYITYLHTNNSMSFGTNDSEAMRIDSSGNVGIGLTNPDRRLHVATQHADGGIIAQFENSNSGNFGGLRFLGGVTDRECRFQSLYGNSFFTFYTEGTGAATERMRIDGGGEVSITAFDNSTTNVALSLKHLNGTGKVQLDWGGNVRAVNTSGIQAIVSERRLKNNIQPIDTNQSWINARDIPWRIFEYLDNPGAKYTGHIVDEVEAIDPTLIFNTGQSDDEGPIRTYDNPLLNAMRFNALQEALKRIETLEAEVAALKAQ